MTLSKRVRRYRGWIGLAALLAVGGAAYGMSRAASPAEAPVTYETASVTRGTLSVTVSGTGNLDLYEQTEVWPSTAGEVESLEVEEGDRVSAGDALFTMDGGATDAAAEKALASYRQSQESVSRAQATLTKTEAALSALRTRYASQPSGPATPAAATAISAQGDSVTRADISSAKADVATAKAGVSSAKAARTSAKRAYDEALAARDDLAVTAPVGGVVWSLGVEEGDSVSARGASTSVSSGASAGLTAVTTGASSSAPLTIVSEDALALKLAVNEVDLPALEVGQRADVEVDALPDLTLTGRVLEIARTGTVSSGVVTFDVWLELDVIEPALKPGMSAAANIVTNVADDTVLVPNGAVESDDDGDYVLVLAGGQETPKRVAIETGLANSTHTQVLSGLSEGDRVVTGTIDPTDEDASGAGGPGGGMMPPLGGMGGGR